MGTEEQRSADAALLAVAVDCLGEGEHMGFVEARLEGDTVVTGGAEGPAMRDYCRVWLLAILSGDEHMYVNQPVGRRRLARQGVQSRAHGRPLTRR